MLLLAHHTDKERERFFSRFFVNFSGCWKLSATILTKNYPTYKRLSREFKGIVAHPGFLSRTIFGVGGPSLSALGISDGPPAPLLNTVLAVGRSMSVIGFLAARSLSSFGSLLRLI